MTVRLAVAEEVRDALAAGGAVVALESSLVAHGLPPPHNVEAALGAEQAVRAQGAVPATIALEGGCMLVGAARDVIERLAAASGSNGASRPLKAAAGDLAPLLAGGAPAGTTVSATLRIARLAGLEVFATGGIGGVHRGAAASFDVSSDIDELASSPLAVVCSGAKSLLDLPATAELLETRRVPVIGLGTDELPAFYSRASGVRLGHRVADAEHAAEVAEIHLSLPGAGSILFVQPPPPGAELDPVELDGITRRAVRAAEEAGIRGGDVTPWVLARVAALTGGRTLDTNVALIVNNARVAAQIAVALARRRRRTAEASPGAPTAPAGIHGS